MTRFAILAYAMLCYSLFALSAIYFAAFLLDDRANPGDFGPGWAAAINLGLVGAFGLAHSVMARFSFKRVWTRFIPPAAERATYVLQSSLFLALIAWQWQPIPGAVWTLEGPAAWGVIALFSAGAAITIVSTFLLGHLEFLGIQQPWDNFRGRAPARPTFRKPLLYRMVRHPLQLGLLIMFFATPHMTADRLILAAAMAGYTALGLRLEERALLRTFGATYARYRNDVPMILPRWPRRFDANRPRKSASEDEVDAGDRGTEP